MPARPQENDACHHSTQTFLEFPVLGREYDLAQLSKDQVLQFFVLDFILLFLLVYIDSLREVHLDNSIDV